MFSGFQVTDGLVLRQQTDSSVQVPMNSLHKLDEEYAMCTAKDYKGSFALIFRRL